MNHRAAPAPGRAGAGRVLKWIAALVTGAGRGIGLAVVRSLVAEGVRVVAAARTPTPALEETGATLVAVDLSDPASAERLATEAVTELGLGSTSCTVQDANPIAPSRPAAHPAGMRFSVNIPNFGDFADPRNVATAAAAAEQAGWDGLFVWDHVLHRQHQGRPFGDPWILLTAAALATSRIRLGTLLTPVPRYRPQQLARQVATLDQLSGGRVTFAAGLGGPVEDEYRSFGDAAEPRVLAERLDEGLELLARMWSGERVNHHGRHYEVRDVAMLPATVQQPRPPVWIGGFWPRRAPMRRAARWDGAVPLFETARHGHVPDAAEVRELVDYVRNHRTDEGERPFEFVLGGATPLDAAKAKDVIGPLHDAGATWWDERQVQTGPDLDRLPPVLRRIEAGPPVL